MHPSILRHTIFNQGAIGHGGNRRSAQIAELIDFAGYSISDIDVNIKTSLWSRFIQGINFTNKYHLEIQPFYKFGACGLPYQIYKKALLEHTGIKLLLWEATREVYLAAPQIAREKQFKVLALPHNLESLVAGQVDPFSNKGLPDSFENEIRQLSLCDEIFCISREEQWLLNLRGIHADFLPYYPPKIILDQLLAIRNLRKDVSGKSFLLLGTVRNQPTLEGYVELIQWLTKVMAGVDVKIDVAGYGTEQLKEICENSNINFHGTVSTEELEDLLINTKGVIVHQKSGVGALTRIPEMLIAGIPVIANGTSCRSAFSYLGVHCYDSQSELADFLQQNLEIPEVPHPPLQAEKRLIDRIRELV
jgi:hypothetical protein